MNARRLLVAGCAVAAVAAAPASALADSQPQVVTGVVSSVVAVTPSAVTLTGMTPGSSTPASGAGTIGVVATSCYDVTIADALNAGYLKNGTTAFSQKLQWKVGSGSFAELSGTPADVAIDQPITLAQTFNMTYQQRLNGENVPAGSYTTTATVTGVSSACAA